MNEVACRRQGNVWRNPGSGSDKAMIPVRRLVVPDSRTTSRTIAVSLAPGDPVWLASERLTAAGGHRRADVLTRTQRLAGGEGVTRTLDCHAGLTARPRKRHRVPLARSRCGRGRSRARLGDCRNSAARVLQSIGLSRSDRNLSDRAIAPSCCWLDRL
jgi:hypothetical protein